jgi:hypothetical protein
MAFPLPLQWGTYYHIYNRGNNHENIFREERNYHHFLKLYAHHIEPIAGTYAYCLLRNHFHFCVRTRAPEEAPPEAKDPSQYFSNFFNAYAKAFNKTYCRCGALFQRPFGRIEVSSEAYLQRLIIYIHQNPQRHGFLSDFREWPYSSYHSLLCEKPTRLLRHEVLDWFGDRTALQACHLQVVKDDEVTWLAPDDLD